MYLLSRPGRERRLRRQASHWALRLASGTLAPAEQCKLHRWLARDTRNGPALSLIHIYMCIRDRSTVVWPLMRIWLALSV